MAAGRENRYYVIEEVPVLLPFSHTMMSASTVDYFP